MNQTAVDADTLKAGPIDSLAADSLAADTSVIYEIPEIVEMTDGFALSPAHSVRYGIPDEDLSWSDAFAGSAFLVRGGLLYHRGLEPYRIPVGLSSRPLNSRLTGYFDLDRLAVQFVDGFDASDQVDIHTLVNRYDRPYSHLRFTALGKTTLYNINFTRPISNQMGFYMAGIYRKARIVENGAPSYETANSFYGNYYWNGFFKTRVDLLYDGGADGELKRSDLLDLSATAGRGDLKLNLFFDYDRTDLDSSSVRAEEKSYGAALSGGRDLRFASLGWRISFKGDHARALYTPGPAIAGQNEYSGRGGFAFAKELGRFRGTMAADLAYIYPDRLYPTPDLSISFDPLDSLVFFLGAKRGYRLPSLSELDSSGFVFDREFPRVGDPGLAPEWSWREEAGCRYRSLYVAVFRGDYDRYILDRYNPFYGYYHPVNIPEAVFTGVETAMELDLVRGFRLGAAADYLIQGEDLTRNPRYLISAGLAWQAEQGRARFKIFGRSRYLGPRYFIAGSDPRPVFTLGALVRFVTLTGCLKVENLLDDRIIDFPVPDRDISLSVKWEFSD